MVQAVSVLSRGGTVKSSSMPSASGMAADSSSGRVKLSSTLALKGKRPDRKSVVPSSLSVPDTARSIKVAPASLVFCWITPALSRACSAEGQSLAMVSKEMLELPSEVTKAVGAGLTAVSRGALAAGSESSVTGWTTVAARLGMATEADTS